MVPVTRQDEVLAVFVNLVTLKREVFVGRAMRAILATDLATGKKNSSSQFVKCLISTF
jgi:hypothetical protein